ncbi:AMSH-like ubiquitin thioesterase 1 isoform X2 [Magnolia sinica]|uniref:AMSH-like ubiquitin thioesterase 1 isoform X2 n=1 Tax=Magnolia sinica TaxID=86752 RepID=UPI00265B15BE|nr:AMSH-like ubiquitin thioesterase 1 isoform X2 [Magnolia sinica]
MEISESKERKRRSDNRFPLSFYFRIANQIINQAKVYRDEQNINDLFITLNRYSSLLSEIIPQHPSYLTYSTKEKLRHQKTLKEFTKEMETLKPRLGRKINEIDGHHVERPNNSVNGSHITSQNPEYHSLPGCNERKGTIKTKTHSKDFSTNCVSVVTSGSVRNCIDPVENIGLASVITIDSRIGCTPPESPCLMSSATAKDCNISVHVVTQSSPSPILSCLQEAPQAAHVSHITVSDSRNVNLRSSSYDITHDVHISARLMEDFLELARTNTNKDLETCGVLGAFLKNRTFYVTTLIIPKQESTSSSCQALNEEEIYAIQDEQSLFPLGWIHVMLAEAFAIVMAPTDATRSYGIFRLTHPGGTTVLKECEKRGFHPHQEPPDGSPIYEDCSNVYINPNLRFEIIDLR